MTEVLNRFMKYVRKCELTSCWIWIGANSGNGYGRFSYQGYTQAAHRISYALHFHKVPTELMVLHKCDNPICVNPAHLELGTAADNTAQMHLRKRGRDDLGANNPMAYLTEDQVREIKIRLCYGEGLTYISNIYKTTKQLIYRIKNDMTWKHINIGGAE